MNVVVLNVGDTLNIHLESNASTGYSWSVAYNPPCLKDMGYTSAPRSHLIGASSDMQWRWLATLPCKKAVLRLRYGRPWDATTWTDAEFRISVAEPKKQTRAKEVNVIGTSGTKMAIAKFTSENNL